jgi:hypothetical protein
MWYMGSLFLKVSKKIREVITLEKPYHLRVPHPSVTMVKALSFAPDCCPGVAGEVRHHPSQH